MIPRQDPTQPAPPRAGRIPMARIERRTPSHTAAPPARFPAPPRPAREPQPAAVRPRTAAADRVLHPPPLSHTCTHESTSHPICSECGQMIIPSPVATFPPAQSPSISVGKWSIYTFREPILTSEEIAAVESHLGIPVPEMIFGHNRMVVSNDSVGWSAHFATVPALEHVKTQQPDGELLQVAHSKAWMSARQEDTQRILHRYDWTYTTDYRGHVELRKGDGSGSGSAGTIGFVPSDESLPVDKLSRPDPILFFDEMVLYEDELGDNGVSVLSLKIRVMPERLLLLMRFFLRVDNVLFRVRDTRLYVEFEDGTVLREYREQEMSYAELRSKVPFGVRDPTSYLRDANWVASKLPIVKKVMEKAVVVGGEEVEKGS